MKDKLDYAPQAPIKPRKYYEPTRHEITEMMTTGKVKPYYFEIQQVHDKSGNKG